MTPRLKRTLSSLCLTAAGLLVSNPGAAGHQVVDFSPKGQSAPTTQGAAAKPPFLSPDSRITTDHLAVIVGPADAAVVPGSRVSLTLDVRPKSGVHVYAPGNADYRPVALRVDPQPNVSVSPTTFPPPEDFYFQPLDEHVKVYEKPFRLVQDVTISGSAAAQKALRASGTLTVSGSFDYQACDDRVCFAPASVPVKWTIRIKEPVR